MAQDSSEKQPSEFVTFLRSALTGSAATVADFAVLAVAVGALSVSARMANVPALLAGAVVQFIGNRYFAFDDATRGCVKRQMWLFTLSEVVALSLNAVLYDQVAQRVPLDALGAVLVRGAICAVIFLGWSYPVWRRIFRSSTTAGSAT